MRKILLIVAVLLVTMSHHVYATGETIIVGSDLETSPRDTISISSVQINGTGNPEITVRLFVSNGSISFTDTSNVTFYNDINEGETIYITGNLEDVNTVLSTMQYYAYGVGEDTLEVSLIGEGQIYFPGNGHIYQIINAGGITHTDAKLAAEALTVDGVSGYLVTITSQEESDFISTRLEGDGWIGATDEDVEGDWKWTGGPEAGTSFWSGLGVGQEPEGNAVGGEFSNWAYGEPNDSSGEDCAQYYSDGGWNDLPCSYTLGYYVAEFGDDENVPSIETAEITITSEADLVLIDSCQELMDLNEDDIGNQYNTIKLTKNIDCTGVTMAPLFDVEGGFRGTFDGQGYAISGINIDNAEDHNVGLFAYLDDTGIIKDLILENGTVSGYENVGALVGTVYDGQIQNVCSNVDVSATYGYAGGLVGYLEDALITRSCATGSVSVGGGSYVGGLVGYVDDSEIIESYASGSIDGADAYVGGLVGYVESGVAITNSYSLSNITANNTCGGVLAYAEGSSEILNSYYAGQLICEDSESTYGLSASDYVPSIITDSFWDLFEGLNATTTLGSLFGASGGRTTTQMKDIATFTTDEDLQDAWNFTTIWNISSGQNNGYPFLRRVQSNTVEEEIVEEPIRRSRSSGGSTVKARVKNLMNQGNIKAADQLKNQFSHIFNSSTPTGGDTSNMSGGRFTRNLDSGATGDDVKMLQKFLNSNGFVITNSGAGSPGNETNLFGGLTKAALIRFQQANGISPAIGYFGPVTRAAIEKLLSNDSTPSVPVENPGDVIGPIGFDRDLELGMTGEDVKRLQEFLIGQNVGPQAEELKAGGMTEYFGSRTKAALIEWQQVKGITPASGYFGSKTRAYVLSVL